MKWQTYATFLLVGFLWGSAWIAAPSLPYSAMFAGAARFAIAAILLGVIAAIATNAKRSANRNLPPFPLASSLLLGVTLTGLPFALTVWAKNLVSVGVVAVLYAAMPLVAFLLEDRISDASGAIPAIAIGMGGVAFLAAQGIDYSARQLGGMLLLGAAVALGAWSLNFAKTRILPGRAVTSAAIQCAVASVFLLLLSGRQGMASPSHWSRNAVVSLTLLAFAEGAIALPLLLWLLTKIDAWQVASLQWLATLFAVAESGVLLRGRPSLQMLLGAAMVVVAILWLMKFRGASGDTTGLVTLQITSCHESADGRPEPMRD